MSTIGVELPSEELPGEDWEHFNLWTRVRESIFALPLYFRSETGLSGLSATDIFTLNAALGATIEDNVVKTLNEMRSVWDPDGEYKLYGFVRQAQTFPDVLLRRYSSHDAEPDIILGIELKGWYVLAKEAEPSFRFQVTPSACALQDMLMVVPWALSDVISGSPQVFAPFVMSARYAAAYRNYHWQNLRKTKLSTGIIVPTGVAPYPAKADQIADKPVSDSGGNFGRVSRTGIMDDYLEEVGRVGLRGIQMKHWRLFFKLFQEGATEEGIQAGMDKIRRVTEEKQGSGDQKVLSVTKILEELEKLL